MIILSERIYESAAFTNAKSLVKFYFVSKSVEKKEFSVVISNEIINLVHLFQWFIGLWLLFEVTTHKCSRLKGKVLRLRVECNHGCI